MATVPEIRQQASNEAPKASVFSELTGQRAMHIGSVVARFGLVFILVVIGGLKFTATEAVNIQPLVTHSPLFAWMNGVFGIQGTSNVFGVFEIATGLLIAARLFSARLSALGSAMAVIVFLGTISFIVTTPGFDVSSMTDQFLFKDFTLLGASIWTLGEALSAAHRKASSHTALIQEMR